MTSKHLNGMVDLFSCLPGDSLANPTLLPGSEEAKKMTVHSGLKCLGLSRKSGPIGLLAKTLVGSSEWDSTIVFLTWKITATKSKRLLFQLVPSMPRTEGTGSGLLRTANRHIRGKSGSVWRRKESHSAKTKWGATLQDSDCHATRHQAANDSEKMGTGQNGEQQYRRTIAMLPRHRNEGQQGCMSIRNRVRNPNGG